MIITFLGHSKLFDSDRLREEVRRTILQNADKDEKILFYCGGYGDFDTLCASVCRSVKEEIRDCEIIFITPYITEAQQRKTDEQIKLGIYDSSIYPPLESVPPKFAISKRNEWMMNSADLVIAYVEYEYGGAYKTLKYAMRKKKRIVNLATAWRQGESSEFLS